MNSIAYENYTVQVYDLAGRQILETNNNLNPRMKLELGSLNAGGIYILKVITDREETFVKRIVSMR